MHWIDVKNWSNWSNYSCFGRIGTQPEWVDKRHFFWTLPSRTLLSPQELREVKEKLRRMKQGKTCTTSEFGRWSILQKWWPLWIMEQSFRISLSCARGSDRHKNEYQAFKQDLEAKLYTLLFSCRILLERKYSLGPSSDLGDLGEKKLYADIFRMSGRQWSPGSSRRSGYWKAICSRNLTTLTSSFELSQDMNNMKICEDMKHDMADSLDMTFKQRNWRGIIGGKKTAFKKHHKHLGIFGDIFETDRTEDRRLPPRPSAGVDGRGR